MPDSSPSKPQEHLTRVLRVRIKDKHVEELREAAYWVNQVWNYCNALSFQVWQRERRFLSGYDLQKFTDGSTKEGLPLHSQTVQAVASEFVTRRRQFKKTKLRWRASGGSRRSLGWIPYKTSAIRYRNGQLHVSGLRKPLSLWDSYDLSKYKLGVTTLSEDARGRWYANITVRIPKLKRKLEGVAQAALGIDAGLKSIMTDSEGGKVEAPRFYRDLEDKLAVAQRARNKPRVRAIHAKIANRRKDFLHKLSTQQVRTHQALFFGNVAASKLAKTKMAKSVLDAGWSTYRTMLQYKSDDAGVWFRAVDESYSTQECSACGARSGPRGLAGLSVRHWVCLGCGTRHDRDVNAARVIRDRGLQWLESEIASAAIAPPNTEASVEAEYEEGARRASSAAGRGRSSVGISVL
jgi:IS605 OrfB family transposase